MIPGWRQPEVNHVRMWCGQTPVAELARQIRKPEHEVEHIIVKLSLVVKPIKPAPRRQVGRKPLWTKEKDSVVIAEYQTTNTAILARKMGVTPNALMKRASKLKVGKSPDHPTHGFWNPEREEILAEMWPHAPMEKIQKALGCSRTLLYTKAKNMGLNRPNRFTANMLSAGNHLRRGDHFTALELLEVAIKTYGGGK